MKIGINWKDMVVFWEILTGIHNLRLHIERLQVTIYSLEIEKKSLEERLKKSNDIIYQYDKNRVELAKKIIMLQSQLVLKGEELYHLNSSLESLKQALVEQGGEVPTLFPEFLDPNQWVYQPTIEVEGERVLMPNPPDIYTQSDMLRRHLGAYELKKKTKYEKAMAAWKWIVFAIKYDYDKADNWQVHPITIQRKKGDCEDGTVAFIDACRALGIAADEAFNVVGQTSFGYHSYPIIYFEYGESPLPEGWYIFETTLDFMPSEPKALNNSSYWCEGGLQNWKYYGQIKTKWYNQFNNVKMPKAKSKLPADRPIEAIRIENDKEKIKKLRDYWRTTQGINKEV